MYGIGIQPERTVVGAMGEVPLVSKAECCPLARRTEALQSCFCRPSRHSMRTARLEIDLPSVRRSPLAAAAPRGGKSEGKSREENRGGDITPIRLRRSLFFIAPATSAGRPSRRKPGETVKALPGRAGCGLSGAPELPKAATPEACSSCRKQPHRMRRRCGRTSCGPGASRARLGRQSGVGMSVRLAVGAQGMQDQKPPPGPPRPPPSHCFPASDCAQLCSMRGAFFSHLSKCLSAVSWEIPVMCAESRVFGRPHEVHRSPRLPLLSGLAPLRRTHNEPMLRKGNVLYCADSPSALFDRSPNA